MSTDRFMKITYHGGPKKMNAYIKMPSPTYAVLLSEIKMCLFEERKLPRYELRTYWIDEDSDDIEIVNQCDYEVFMTKKSERQHLQVAPITEPEWFSGTAAAAAAETTTETEPDAVDPTYKVVHTNVTCDHCNVTPITGFRYKCIQCPDYDLCQRCEAAHKHPEHMLLRMPNTNCPSVVETWITGGYSPPKRSNKRPKGYCPYAEPHFGTFYDTPVGDPDAPKCIAGGEPLGKAHHRHHGRKHRHQQRNGIFTHLYDMMQDLAEGGASTRNRETATSEPSTPNVEAATKAAEATAKVATDIAAKAAEACNVVFGYTPTAPTADAGKPRGEAQQKNDKSQETKKDHVHTTTSAASTSTAATATSTAETNTSASEPEPERKQSKETNTENGPRASVSTPILGSPSLENLTQFVDPQYMKAGIQILNNFSEMFAKMLDPVDGAGMSSCPFQSSGATTRKTSTSSAKSTTSGNAAAGAKEATPEKAASPPASAENAEKQLDSSTISTASTTEENSLVSINTPIENAQTPERRRSQSEESDWQIIDKQSIAAAAPTATAEQNKSDISVVMPLCTESIGVGNTANAATATEKQIAVVNYAQLSRDLKTHVDLEMAREELMKQQRQHLQVETATAVAAALNEGIPLHNNSATTQIGDALPKQNKSDEKRAVLVFHSDERINNAVHAMMAMGFSNEGAWLTQLLESVNGNIPEALDIMSAAQRSNR